MRRGLKITVLTLSLPLLFLNPWLRFGQVEAFGVRFYRDTLISFGPPRLF